MNILLPPEIAHALAEEARRQRTTKDIIALDCLRERFLPSVPQDRPGEGTGTLADFLVGHIGVLSSSEYIPGGAQLAEQSGKKFAAGLVKQRQQGRL